MFGIGAQPIALVDPLFFGPSISGSASWRQATEVSMGA